MDSEGRSVSENVSSVHSEEAVAGPSGLSSGRRITRGGRKRSAKQVTSISLDIPQKKRKRGIRQVLELSEPEFENVLRAFSSDEEFSDEEYESEGEEEGSQTSERIVSGTPATTVVPFSPSAVSNPLDTAIAHSSSAVFEPRPIVWNLAPPSIPNIPFTGIPGLRKIPSSQTPRGYFDLLFSDKLYELILTETEKFAEQLYLDSPYQRSRIAGWKTLEKKEFQVWLGLLFHMGHIQINRLESYWRTDPLYRIPIFAEKMSRDRFLLIMQALHFAENPSENQQEPVERLYKIRPLIDIFHETMRDVEYPIKNLSLDESMVLWRGRLIFRQYVQGKKHKHGIKIYMLTEPSGLVLRIHVYAGSADQDVGGTGHTGKVVNHLLKNFKNKGHSIFMDNFYNSVDLSTQLLAEKTHTTGTLRVNRKNNPAEVLQKKLPKGEVICRWSNEGVCVLKWHDKRDVLLLSTEFGPEMIEVPNKPGVKKPRAVVEYNNSMGGIDHFDQLMSYYTCEHRSLKWYKKIGIHIFQVVLLNSYFLFNKYSGEKKSLFDFRHEVINSLLSLERRQPSVVPHIQKRHFPQLTPISESRKKHRIQKRCRVCYGKGIKKMVTYFCPDCTDAPGLCIECFLEYNHEM